jgi:hypothetical protein
MHINANLERLRPEEMTTDDLASAWEQAQFLRARAIESADQARMAAWHKRCGALREELVARQLYFRLLDPGAPAA